MHREAHEETLACAAGGKNHTACEREKEIKNTHDLVNIC